MSKEDRLAEPDDDAVAAAWSSEIERRSREMDEGEVKPVEWCIARAELLAELKLRRAYPPAV